MEAEQPFTRQRRIDQLRLEQFEVQKQKHQGRLIEEYDAHLFPGTSLGSASAVSEHFAQHYDVSQPTVHDILASIQSRQDKAATWVDMGGGRGLAMRQLALSPDLRSDTRFINVDLFDYDLEGLTREELTFLEQRYPGATDASTKPRTLLADMAQVELSTPADLITSVETIQYLDDPLQALTHWYNNLDDGGHLIVAAEHNFATWIRYQGTFQSFPLEAFTHALTEHRIAHAFTDESDYVMNRRERPDPSHMRALTIQKKPHTKLQMSVEPTKTWANDSHYKAVYYPQQTPIEVIEAR